jgi:hypothetical protein
MIKYLGALFMFFAYTSAETIGVDQFVEVDEFES